MPFHQFDPEWSMDLAEIFDELVLSHAFLLVDPDEDFGNFAILTHRGDISNSL